MFCEWKDKVIGVGRGSGLVKIQSLRAQEDKYEPDICRSYSLPPSKFSSCLKCVSLLDYSQGWSSPHLLVTRTAQRPASTTHELLVCDSEGSFQECGLQFEVEEDDLPVPSEEECWQEDAYHLMDGPVVLWKRGGVVHVAHGPHMQQQACVFLRKPSLPVESIRRMWCVPGESSEGCDPPSVLLLLQLLLKSGSHSGSELGERDWMCLEVRVVGGVLKASKTAPVIPADYGYIASCVTPYRWHRLDERSGSLVEGAGYLVGTEYRHVVVVEEGRVRQVISLEDIPRHLVYSKSTGDKFVMAAMLPNRTASVHEVTESGYQDVGVWRGVSGCVVGDFAQLGCSQLLMLPDKECSGCYYLRKPNILSVEPPPPVDQDGSGVGRAREGQDVPESLLNVLKALQLKKHIAEAQVMHQEMALEHKYDLLAKSLKFMESLGRDDMPIATDPDPGLVCLIPGKVRVAKGLGGEGVSKKPLPDLRVLRVWQRVMAGGLWVVCVLLRNESQRILTNVGASLLAESDHALPIARESSSRVVWREPLPQPLMPPFLAEAAAAEVEAGISSRSPPRKRQRVELEVLGAACWGPQECPGACRCRAVPEPVQPNQAFCVGMVMEGACPGGTGATVWGTWCREGDSVVQMGEWGRMGVTAQSLCSGELCVDEQCLRLWDGSLSLPGTCKFEDSEVQDLACLMATWSLTQVVLRTRHTLLSRLPSMLRARLPLPPHALQFSNSSLHQHLSSGCPPVARAHGASKMLEGIAIHVRILSEHAVVGILYRSWSDLKLVLKLMKDLLPDDVRFSLVSDSLCHCILWKSLSAVGEEAIDMFQTLRAVLEASDIRTDTEGEGEGLGEDGVVINPSSLGDPKLALATDNAVRVL